MKTACVIIVGLVILVLRGYSSEGDTTVAIKYSDEFMIFTPERMVEKKPDTVYSVFPDSLLHDYSMSIEDNVIKWMTEHPQDFLDMLFKDYYILKQDSWMPIVFDGYEIEEGKRLYMEVDIEKD